MDFTEYERKSGKRFTGLATVVLLHLFIVYALVTGLARKVVEVIKQPIETKIIEEVKPPPPPDLPPPPPPPKLLAPPPPFIPPPEVQIQQPQQQQNTITAVSSVKPDSPFLPPAHRIDGPVDTARKPVRIAAVVDSRACEKPDYPPKSLRNEEQGTVTLEFLIGIDGRVVDSKIFKSSGFRDLDRAAIAGLSLCKFKPGTVDGKPEQSWTKMQYVWKLE
jgi:protein TonB